MTHFRICATTLCVLMAAMPLFPARATELASILQQQRELASELDAAGTALTPRQKNLIRKAQAEVFALTENKSTLDQLDITDKVRLENALERINAQIKGTRLSSEEKQVCWRERKSGTKLMVTRCGTQAEIDAAREGARAWMEKPKICVPPGCG